MDFRVKNGFAILALALLMPVASNGVQAEVTTMTACEQSPFTGKWKSQKSDENFLIRLDVTDKCEKVVTRPVSMNSPWSGMLGREQQYVYRQYMLRPSSPCSPANCVWGRSKGKHDDEKGVLKASFRMFWSQRFLELTPEKGKLRVRWRIQYIGRKKPDQLGETLLVRMP